MTKEGKTRVAPSTMLLKFMYVLQYCYIATPPPTTISFTLIVGIASETGTP